MATVEEIQKAFGLLLGAGLDFSPTREEIPMRAKSWVELLQDVPGDLLIQAAKDISIDGEKFPSIKVIRTAAHNVKVHNNTSAAVNRFAPLAVETIVWYVAPKEQRIPYPKELDALLQKDHERWTRQDHEFYQRVTGGPLFSQVSDDFWLTLQGEPCTA